MEIRLNGKVILISGITGAIGERAAGRCFSLGAEVYGIYGKDKSSAEILYREKRIRSASVDFTQKKISTNELDALLKSKKIYALINAGGITMDKPLIRMDEKSWDEVLAVNLSAIFYLTRAALPLIVKGGRIINLSSSVGLIGEAGQANYASAKAGLWAFTKALAREAAINKIMVNMVLPGFVLSKMTKNTAPFVWKKAEEESLTNEFVRPEIVSDFIAYLLSEYADGITGQAFNIDNRIRRWW